MSDLIVIHFPAAKYPFHVGQCMTNVKYFQRQIGITVVSCFDRATGFDINVPLYLISRKEDNITFND